MTRIIWVPRKNTEREAIRKFGDSWFLLRRSSDSVLISNGPNWLTSNVRWIFASQVVGEEVS